MDSGEFDMTKEQIKKLRTDAQKVIKKDIELLKKLAKH